MFDVEKIIEKNLTRIEDVIKQHTQESSEQTQVLMEIQKALCLISDNLASIWREMGARK